MTIGIYKIINKINHKVYIGQSCNIERRIKEHKLESSWYDNKLYRAFIKYGIKEFDFEILEETSIEKLDEREIFFIKFYNSCENGYNITAGGHHSTPLVLTWQQAKEIKELLKSEQTMESIAKIYNINYKTVSDINMGNTWVENNIEYPIRTRNKSFCIDCGKSINKIGGRCLACYKVFISLNRKNKLIIKNGIKEYYKLCIDCNAKITITSQRCNKCHGLFVRKERPAKEEIYQKLIEKNGNFTQVSREYKVSDNTVRNWCKEYHLPHKSSDYKTRLTEEEILKEKERQRKLTELRQKQATKIKLTFKNGNICICDNKNEVIDKLLLLFPELNRVTISKGLGKALNGSRKSYKKIIFEYVD